MTLPNKAPYIASIPEGEKIICTVILEKLDATTLHDANLFAAYSERDKSSVEAIAVSFLDVFIRSAPQEIQEANFADFINEHREVFVSYIVAAINEYGEKSKMRGHHPDYKGGTPLALLAIPNHQTGLVDMNFSQSLTRVGLYPKQAMDFAMALVDAAEEIIRLRQKKKTEATRNVRNDEPSQN